LVYNSCCTALTGGGQVRLLASRKNWIEGEAVSQLRKTAALPGMRLAVVISDMVEAGLIRVVATLKPLITYKVRRPS
jgi:hypothetical protein